MSFNPVLSTTFSRAVDDIRSATSTPQQKETREVIQRAIRRRSSGSRSSSSVLSVAPETPAPKDPPVIQPGVTDRNIVSSYNQQVLNYNQDLAKYQAQFVRPDGFRPGEPLYLELGDEGVKDDVLVKDDEDPNVLKRSGFQIDGEQFQRDIEDAKREDAERKKQEQDDARETARRVSKPDPNKQLFGTREPGTETISDRPTYNVYDPAKDKTRTPLSGTQLFEFVVVRTFLPQYWGITREEYKRDVYNFGSPARVLSETGDKMIQSFKNISWEDRQRPVGAGGESLTVGLFSTFGTKETADYYREREARWMSLTDKAGEGLFKGASVTGQVVGEVVKDPVPSVALFAVGGLAGKTAKVLKPVAVRYSAWVGSRSVPVRSALKGASIGLKTSAVGVIGGSVVMDVARADDPALRTAQITKDFALLGAGFRAGLGKPKISTKTVSKPNKNFPEGYKQVSLDFYPKSEMAVKSGKSPMSKASIRRQSRGLPQKGKKSESFLEYRGDQGQIEVPRKIVETGQSKVLKIEKLKPSQQTTTKISTGGLPYKDKGGLQLKRFDVTTQARATTQIDRTYRVKPIQRGVRLESSQNIINKPRSSQIPRPGLRAKEVASYQTQSSGGVLLQEQKSKQLLSVQIKQLARTKSPSNRVLQTSEVFKKQQFNLQKGQAPRPQTLEVPKGSQEAQAISKSQGRGEVVDKILARARAKAEARQLELKAKETLIKPKPQTQTTQTTQIQGQSKKTELDQNPFSSLTKKKKQIVLVEQETTYAPRVSMDGKIGDDNLIVPIISIRTATSSPQRLAFQPNIKSESLNASRLETSSAQIISPIVRSVQRVESGNMLDQAVVQDQERSPQTSITPIQITRPRSPTPKPTLDPIIRDPIPVSPDPRPPQIKPPKPPRPQPPELKDPKPPRLPSLGLPSRGRAPSLGAGFVVSVRRSGVFSPVGFFSSPQEAFVEGQRVVGGTAGASFKVSDPKGEVVPTSSFSLGNRFRPSKTERGVVVERRKYRISSPGELEEITYKGLMSQKRKRGRGGFNLF
jgi:hypothetical protein